MEAALDQMEDAEQPAVALPAEEATAGEEEGVLAQEVASSLSGLPHLRILVKTKLELLGKPVWFHDEASRPGDSSCHRITRTMLDGIASLLCRRGVARERSFRRP